MENKDKPRKIEEPFDPQRTPEPAQVKDPNKQGPQAQENTGSANKPAEKKEPGNPQKSKKLGESETEIDDETTI